MMPLTWSPFIQFVQTYGEYGQDSQEVNESFIMQILSSATPSSAKEDITACVRGLASSAGWSAGNIVCLGRVVHKSGRHRFQV